MSGLWPDAPARESIGLLPDADRIAPIPAQEASAELPTLEPTGAEAAGGSKAKAPKKTAVKPRPLVQQRAATVPPSTVVKPRRTAKRKSANVRESDSVGVR